MSEYERENKYAKRKSECLRNVTKMGRVALRARSLVVKFAIICARKPEFSGWNLAARYV